MFSGLRASGGVPGPWWGGLQVGAKGSSAEGVGCSKKRASARVPRGRARLRGGCAHGCAGVAGGSFLARFPKFFLTDS